ncbi:TPR-like protein [Peniophora sp. CONT]|nr:TPR-like protein [Peniophora sp. CONT]
MSGSTVDQPGAGAYSGILIDRQRELGDVLGARYESLGDADTTIPDEAVEGTPIAVELEQGKSDSVELFLDLGDGLDARLEIKDALGDLEDAISVDRRAIELAPTNYATQSSWFLDLGNALLTRFEHSGDIKDLEYVVSAYRRAVESTPEGHSDTPLWHNDIGILFTRRFECSGEFKDLEQAVSAHQRAVELTQDHHPNKPALLVKLGASLLACFERTYGFHDLKQAISAHRQALKLTPVGHPDQPAMLNNLGMSLLTRSQYTGEPKDLDQAILFHRQAIDLTPTGHPDQPLWFTSLGNSLSLRFKCASKVEDLELAVSAHRSAVDLTSDDHPHKPSRLNNLCQDLRAQYERAHELADIASAISAGQLAIELCPEGHPDLYHYYGSLAVCLQHRFERVGDIDDIEKAISLLQKAVELVHDAGPCLSPFLMDLGSAQRQRFERTQARADFDASIQTFITLIMQSPIRTPTSRLKAARRCIIMLSKNSVLGRSTDALLLVQSCAITILPEIIYVGHDIHGRYEISSRLGDLVNDAASAAIADGSLTEAVEWLEAGEALIWAQVLSLRVPLDDLQESHPHLGTPLSSVHQRLQSFSHCTSAPDTYTFGGTTGITLKPALDRRRGLVIEYNVLLKEIRGCTGFEDFLLPKSVDSLVPSLELLGGPLILINMHPSHCDAIVLSPGKTFTSIVLPDLSVEKAKGLTRLWVTQLVPRMGRERGVVPTERLRGYLNPFTLVLEQLWLWIVRPVLESLDLISLVSNLKSETASTSTQRTEASKQAQDNRLPHVTWCPRGLLASLPLHAAGMYNDPCGPRVFDFVVSSYSPSLAALPRSSNDVAHVRLDSTMLLVTQPATPNQSALPGTAKESAALLRAMAQADVRTAVLDDKDATVTAVQAAMLNHPWVHLACHGTQDIVGDASHSAFLLHDGRLSLAALMSNMSDDAELAFLSACHTATGYYKHPEESSHVTAGMLAIGFKAVIGTTWSIRDDDAPVVVEAFYKELLLLRSVGKLGRGETGAAYALHEATRVLRERVGENGFMRWVPFVHFGI